MAIKQMLGRVITVGEDGSITIPFDMLEGVGIKLKGKVEVFTDINFLYLRTADEDEVCDFCNMNNGKTSVIGDKKICSSCLTQLSQSALQVE